MHRHGSGFACYFHFRAESARSLTLTDPERGSLDLDLEPSSMNTLVYWWLWFVCVVVGKGNRLTAVELPWSDSSHPYTILYLTTAALFLPKSQPYDTYLVIWHHLQAESGQYSGKYKIHQQCLVFEMLDSPLVQVQYNSWWGRYLRSYICTCCTVEDSFQEKISQGFCRRSAPEQSQTSQRTTNANAFVHFEFSAALLSLL